MFGLTTLGTVHTAIAVLALACGVAALLRDGFIAPRTAPGRAYLAGTALTCLTALGIFQHGGFGLPHVLALLTLLVIAIIVVADRSRLFGAASRQVIGVAGSLTIFFHLVPGVTETFTRVPVGSPLFSGPEDPALQKVVGAMFLVFLAGAVLQARKLKGLPAVGMAREPV